MKSSKIKDRQLKLAEKLVSLHLSESPYTRLPGYNYDQLEKGIICASCHSFVANFSAGKIVCDECGCIEETKTAILRSVDEFKLLFPDRKITTGGIFEWCKVIKSKKTIRRILLGNFNLEGHARASFYVKKQ